MSNDKEQKEDPMHSANIREDGTIDDCIVETIYHPCNGFEIVLPSESTVGYLRVNFDSDALDGETRISFDTLKRAGFTFTPAQKEGDAT